MHEEENLIKKILIYCLLSLNFTIGSANDELQTYRLGLFAGPNYVLNKTSMAVIPGADDCGNYSNGQELSYFFGISYTYKLLPKLVWLEGRLMFDSRPAYLSAESSGYQVYQTSSDSYVPLVRKHEFESSMKYLAVDLGVRFNPPIDLPFFARLSFDAGNPIVNSEYLNTEKIIAPSNVNYPNQSKTAIVESGNLESAGTALGASLAIGYEYILKNGVNLSPEISFRKGLNSITSDRDWNMDILRLAVHVSYDFGNPKEEILPPKEPEPVIQEIEPEPENVVIPKASPKIISVKSNSLNLTETIVTQTYPILPYMFFDSASAEVRAIYQSDNLLSNESQLPKNSLNIYYKFLDIIGKRLAENPNSNITLIGVSDGIEIADSVERTELALKRAKNTAKYIIEKYKLNPNNVNIKSRDLPQIPTSNKYAEGPQENRRVEFMASNPDILKPVSHSHFIEYYSEKDNIILSAEIANSEEVDSIKYEILKGGNSLESITSTNLHDAKIKLHKNLIDELGNANVSNTNANIRTTIFKDGVAIDSDISKLEILADRNKFELGRLNLIVFDFDKSTISSVNKVMLKEFISNNISNESQIKIKGSTDKLGEKDYNIELSNARAEAVEKYILSINEKANIIDVKGIGPDELSFDNNLPEGRFYCRTVLIEVKTPTNEK